MLSKQVKLSLALKSICPKSVKWLNLLQYPLFCGADLAVLQAFLFAAYMLPQLSDYPVFLDTLNNRLFGFARQSY
jgi:hypothetical protein